MDEIQYEEIRWRPHVRISRIKRWHLSGRWSIAEEKKNRQNGNKREKGGKEIAGRAPRCPGWNLKYRASRTSTLAPETRRRDAPRRLDARRRRRHQGKPGNRTWTPLRAREAGTAFTEPPIGIGWNFQQVKKWKFQYVGRRYSDVEIPNTTRWRQFRVYRIGIKTRTTARRILDQRAAAEGYRMWGWQTAISLERHFVPI